MFSDKLYYILSELEQHKHSDRSVVLASRIQERLDKALTSYIHTITDSYAYLSSKDELNVLKKFNRNG